MELRPTRTLSAVAMILIAAALFGACGDDDDDGNGSAAEGGEPITIGFALGLSGGILDAYDGPALFAAEKAIDDINAEGGVDGRQLEAEVVDTKSDAEQAANAAVKLLDGGADVLVVPCDFDFGGGTAATEAEKQGVLAMSSCGASVRFGPSGTGPLTFTMATSGAGEGSTMAEWAAEELGAQTAATIVDTTFLYGAESVGGFEGRFPAVGGEIVASEQMKNDDQSFATQISAVEAAQPDVLYVSAYNPGAARLLRQIRRAGIDIPILWDEDIDGDYWKEALSEEDLNDIYFTTYASIYGDDPEEKLNALVDEYVQAEGSENLVAAGLTGYSVVEAIAEAVRETGGSTEGAELAEVMQGWADKEFLIGPTTYTEVLHITPVREQRIMQIENGETSFLETFRPEEVALPEDVASAAAE